MRTFISKFLIAVSLVSQAMASPPVIWNGTNAKFLNSGTIVVPGEASAGIASFDGSGNLGSAVLSPVAHQWIDSIVAGVAHMSQPSFSDLLGLLTNSQLPDMNVQAICVREDFIGNSANLNGFTGNTNSGTFAINTTLLDGNHPGILDMSTAAGTTAGPAETFGAAKSFVIGGGPMFTHSKVRYSALSGGTDTYTSGVGFDDNATGSITPNNGALVTVTDSVNSGHWVGQVYKATVSGTCNGTHGPSANTWYDERVDFNAAGTTATFGVDGVQECQITGSSLPATTTPMSFEDVIKKSAGGTAVHMYVDYMEWCQASFTTPR